VTAPNSLELLCGKPPGPFVDPHCTLALEHAIKDLAFQRFIASDALRDPSVQLHVLASLIELAQRWLHEEVHNARQAGASWAQIGRLLGLPATAARAIHAPSRTPPALPNPNPTDPTTKKALPLANP
jgi:hypothetical protein